MDADVAAIALCLLLKKKKEMKRKRLWTREWLARRRNESVCFRLLRELGAEEPDTMRQWLRLDKTQFHTLLSLVTPIIQKNTNMRSSVMAAERLTLTLRYLATIMGSSEELPPPGRSGGAILQLGRDRGGNCSVDDRSAAGGQTPHRYLTSGGFKLAVDLTTP